MNQKFIYFDVGNVLFNVTNWMADLAHKHQKTYQDFRTIFDPYHDSLCKGTITLQALWPMYVTKLSLSNDNFDLERFWLDHCIPIPKTHAFLKNTVSFYYIGILTNTYKGLLRPCIQEGKIPDLPYASIINSSQYGYKKPEDKIYEIAEEKSCVSPENILYIDNKEDFLVPAQTRGWHTILFHPDAVSKSIDEIQTFLTKQF